MRGFYQLVDDGALRRLSGAAFDMLDRLGMKVEHEGMLSALKKLGCEVDDAAMHARFPAKVLDETLTHYSQEGIGEFELPRPEGPLRTGTGGVFPHLLEWPSGVRRLATREDVIAMTKMADRLEAFSHVGLPVVDCQAPQRIEPILSRALVMQYTLKPFSGSEVIYGDNVKYLAELADIAAGGKAESTGVASCNFAIAPLYLWRRACDCVMAKFECDIPFVAGTMPISGLSGPVTVAGTAALMLAETLGCWTIARALRPELPVGCIVCSGSLDMRTTRACFASPEAALQDVAAVQVAHRIWGTGSVHTATSYIDAKTPGIQATYEKMFKALCSAPFVGSFGPHPDGLLSAGQDYSPTQHMLSMDIGTSINRFQRTFDVTDETLGLEAIEQVGIDTGRTFLDHDHTLEHWREEMWMPELMDRRIWQGDQEERRAEREMLEQAEARWRDAVASYERPDIPEERLRAVEDVCRRARKDILGA